MMITACIAKLHRLTVTEADLNYVGSITLDQDLLEASGIIPRQYVNITNLSNAAFWRTYVMAGKKGNRDVCLNGPPARLFQPGDKIIVLAEVQVTIVELREMDTTIVFVDDNNKVTAVKKFH